MKLEDSSFYETAVGGRVAHARPFSRRRVITLAFVGAVMLGALVVVPAFDNGLVSDDWVFVYPGIANVPGVGAFGHVPSGWFSRPIMWVISYWLARVFGSSPLIFHVFTFLVHGLNALLVVLVARLVFDRLAWQEKSGVQRRYAWLVAWAAGWLFFVYSQSHEVLYWFSAVPEALAFLFRLSALSVVGLLLVRKSLGLRGRLAMCGVLAILTALALGTKESALVLTGEIGLISGVSWWNSWRGTRQGRERFDVLTAILSVLTAASVSFAWYRWYSSSGIVRSDLGILELGPGAWLLRFGQAAWRAIAFGHTFTSVPIVLAPLVVGLFLLSVAIRRQQLAVVFSLLWCCLCLLPYVAITAVSDQRTGVAVLQRMTGIAEDRYYYSAGAALALLLMSTTAWLVAEVAEWRRGHTSNSRRPARWPGAVPVLMVALLSLAHVARLVLVEREWDHAGQLVADARVELKEVLADAVAPGDVICVTERPDNFRGRYVLRSGVKELIYLTLGREDVKVLVPPYLRGAVCDHTVSLGQEIDSE